MAFFNLEGPTGGRRGDYQAALVAQTLANVWRGEKQRPFKLQDFLLDFAPPERRALSADEIVRRIEMWNVALGGADLRERTDQPPSRRTHDADDQ